MLPPTGRDYAGPSNKKPGNQEHGCEPVAHVGVCVALVLTLALFNVAIAEVQEGS
jgi:hypothetical protein